MYQDSIILSEKTQISESLRMENMCDANGYYWFTFLFYNALFKMDKKTWKAQYVCSFPEEVSKNRMYSKIISYKMKLYCIPLSANSIGVYDMASNECISIRIEEPKRKGEIIYKEDSKFIDATIDEDYLYLLPHTYPAVVRMRFSDEHIDYFYESLISMKPFDQFALLHSGYYFGRFTQSGGNRWAFSYASEKVCRFSPSNIKFEKCDYISIKGQAILVSGSYFIWMFSLLDSVIYKINLETGNCIKISELPKSFIPGSTPITRGILYGNYVFFLPGTANKSIKVDIKTNEVSLAEELCPGAIDMFAGKEIWKFGLLECLDEKLYAFDASDNQLIEYDIRNRRIRKQEVTVDLSDEKTERWMNDYLWFADMNSHRVRNLSSFLKLLIQENVQADIELFAQAKNKANCFGRNIGQCIYKEIIRETKREGK